MDHAEIFGSTRSLQRPTQAYAVSAADTLSDQVTD